MTLAKCNCKNCLHVDRMRGHVLHAARPAGKGITDYHVFMWNETLRRFPCLKDKP